MTATLERPGELRRQLREERRRPRADLPRMGQQPGLDGLRALSVIAVILYHAGFSWMKGGFFGVEVFFVVSGFLITTLLLEERERTRGTDLGSFWLRRARRLLPALFAMLAAVAVWGVVAGSAEQVSQLRRDLPWSILYVANWGQILGDVPYFAAGDPPLLRHLWSLAVEEQWYLIWPLVFVAFARTRLAAARIALALAATSFVVMAFTAWLALSQVPVLGGPPALFDGTDRVNFMYLSTITRSSGLLLGAAAAYVWRPWRSPVATSIPAVRLDVAAGVSVGLLGCIASVAVLTEQYVYLWLLPIVTVLSVVAIMCVVHPAATGARLVFGHPWLVAIGQRSYGLYLWHWPIFVILGATEGSWASFVVAMAIAAAISEVSFRFLEQPIRRHGLAGLRERYRLDPRPVLAGIGVAAALVVGVAAFYARSEPFDAAAGGEATFEQPAAEVLPAPESTIAAVAPTAPPVPAQLPVTLAVVGDSQAHSLAINAPDGIEGTFDVENGAVSGCSVFDTGRVRSTLESFDNSFAICEGWQQQWAEASAGADVTLVAIGAWDVFDVEADGQWYVFASPEWDALFLRNLQSGVDAVVATGSEVALLEVPCMRPVEAEGAGVPPLPERADDSRVAHLNDLLRQVAASNPGTVTFVEGADAWCADEAIATDLNYRWDGVHVYKPGAKLTFETIAPAVLAIAA
ncbi:MAG: acyltransferase [Ilumatobacteraceae bacterium]|nr:acyltransferase [Ilumatobacteraceae bacterium]